MQITLNSYTTVQIPSSYLFLKLSYVLHPTFSISENEPGKMQGSDKKLSRVLGILCVTDVPVMSREHMTELRWQESLTNTVMSFQELSTAPSKNSNNGNINNSKILIILGKKSHSQGVLHLCAHAGVLV